MAVDPQLFDGHPEPFRPGFWRRLFSGLGRSSAEGPSHAAAAGDAECYGGGARARVTGAGALAAIDGAHPFSRAQLGDAYGAFERLFVAEDRARVRAAREGAGARRVAARARAADGTMRDVELLFDAGPAPDGARRILILDRTDEAGARSEAVRAAASARADAKTSAKRLADLSHEMKTPLNAVIGFAEAIARETFGPIGNPRYHEYAEHIAASGRHLLELVTVMLDMARIDADRMTLAPVKADPGRLAVECADMVRLAAEEAGLALKVEIADDLPLCRLDPRAIRQILLNLLTNAVKFTSDGEVRLSAAREGARIVYVVADTGVGMSADDLAALGPRFTAAQGEGVRGAEGAGLGLSLVRKLVDLHGGALSLNAAPGEGVTARVALPIDADFADRARLSAAGVADADGDDEDAAAGRASHRPLTAQERLTAHRRRTDDPRCSADAA